MLTFIFVKFSGGRGVADSPSHITYPTAYLDLNYYEFIPKSHYTTRNLKGSLLKLPILRVFVN